MKPQESCLPYFLTLNRLFLGTDLRAVAKRVENREAGRAAGGLARSPSRVENRARNRAQNRALRPKAAAAQGHAGPHD